MAVVQVLGKKTYYEEIGTGPFLFLLHGWANTWEAWLPIIPYLSDHFTLIIPDLPGFGKSEEPSKGWSTIDYAVWLSAFLNTEKFKGPNKEFYALGHSFGGKILALYSAKQYAPLASKQVFIEASGLPYVLSLKQRTLKILASVIPYAIKDSLPLNLKEILYKGFGAETDYIHANAFQQHTLLKILPEDLTNDLVHIKIPTLLIWGDKQKKFPPLEHGKDFHKHIADSKLSVWDADHFPHHAYPKEVSLQIIEFLEDHK